jgi:hypothetical protein
MRPVSLGAMRKERVSLLALTINLNDSPRPGTKRILAVEGGVGASARPPFPFVCDADWLHAGEPLASGFFACSP